MAKIAIIGSGNVGSALERGLSRAGHEVRKSRRGDAQEKAAWGEVVILAVPFSAIDDVVTQLEALRLAVEDVEAVDSGRKGTPGTTPGTTPTT